jgi:hypothetical protein
MVIPISTMPAVRQYLFDQITATLTADPINTRASLVVCFDDPGTNEPEDIVVVGKIERQIAVNSMVGSGGAGYLEERYTVEITIEAYRGSDDAQAVFSRAALLADGVVSVVRSDLSLGGLVLVAKPTMSSHSVAWNDQHTGRIAEVILHIECFQRI